MGLDKIELLKSEVEGHIIPLKSGLPVLNKELDKILTRLKSMTESQLSILNERLKDFAKIHDQLIGLDRIELLKSHVEGNIIPLKSKLPNSNKELDKLLTRSKSMTESQLSILNGRLKDFASIHDQLMLREEQCEWMIQVAPNLFAKTEKIYSQLQSKLLDSKKLDKVADPTWQDLKAKLNTELQNLEDPTEQVKIEFLSHFGEYLHANATKFFDKYKVFMDKLAEQKEKIINDNSGKIDKVVLNAEIDKQLKLVQAQVILAISAARMEEKALNLKLAGSALSAAFIAFTAAGAGVAIVATAGSAVPIIGTAIGGAVGLVVGGVIGGTKGYHAYKEAKARYQAEIAKTFNENPDLRLEKAASINAGIASVKTREAFNWLMKGPQESDYERMIHKYKSANVMYTDQQISDLKIRLRSEFVVSRSSYCSMLHEIIRSSVADSALQAVAGLTIAPPFDNYSALDISRQLTVLCHMQIGTARAMGGLEPLPEFPVGDNIPVTNSKNLALDAASQLASNSETLAALAQQIALCSNLDEAIQEEILADIHESLVNTIISYDELAKNNPDLDIKSSLGDILIDGIVEDIEHMGEKDKPKKQKSLEGKTYSAVLASIKKSKFAHGEDKSHKKEKKSEVKSIAKSAAEVADTLINVMAGTGAAVFIGPAVNTTPEIIHVAEVGTTGFSAVGIGVGSALAGLALSAGIGAYYLNAKADEKEQELCVFGNVTKRRERFYENLAEKVELSFRTEDRLHTLIDAPDTVLYLDRAIKKDTLVSRGPKSEHEQYRVSSTGWNQNESPLPVTGGQKKYGKVLFDKLNQSLDSLKSKMVPRSDRMAPIDKHYSEEMDVSCYNPIMKMLISINKLSQSNRLDVVSEKEILDSLKENLAVLEKITAEDFADDNLKKEYHEQKIGLINKEIIKLESQYEKHLKKAAQIPRDFKAIAMDSDRMNDKLDFLIKLINEEIQMLPSAKDDTIHALIGEIKLIVDRQKGELPEGASIELVQQAYALMVPERITLRSQDRLVITLEMIARLREKQTPDMEDDSSSLTRGN